MGSAVGGGLVLGLAAILLLALQVDRISTLAGRAAAGLVSSDSLRVDVERVRITGLTRLELAGVRATRLSGGDSVWSVALDTASTRIRLRPLLSRTLSLRHLALVGVEARIETAPDTADGAEPAWAVEVDEARVEVRRLGIERRSGPETDAPGPEPWTLTDGRLRLSSVTAGRAPPGAVVEAFTAAFRPPGRPEGWGTLELRGALLGSELRVDTLVARSPESDVAARGVVPLELRGTAPSGLRLDATASPLLLADLGPLRPAALADSLRLELRADARAPADTLHLSVTATSNVPGRLELTGALWGDRDRPLSRMNLSLDGLALRDWGLTDRALEVDATLETDLVGTSLDEARGRVAGRATVVEPGGALDGGRGRVELEAPASGGPWAGRWSLAVREGEAEGAVRVDPSGTPSWFLDGRVAWAGRLGADDGAGRAFVRGDVTIEGRGTRPDSLDGRLEARVDSAGAGPAVRAGPVRLLARLRGGEASAELDGAVAGGRVVLEARGDLPSRSATLTRGRIEGVDVAALLGDSVASTLTAELSGDLDGLAPLRAEGTVRLLEGRYGGWAVDSARATVSATGPEARLRLAAALPGSGRIDLDGRARRGDTLGVQIDSLAWSAIDLRALGGGETAGRLPSTRLTGTGRARLARHAGEWRGTGRLALEESRIREVAVERATAEVDLEPGVLAVGIDAETGAGELQGSARVEGAPPRRRISVEELRFQGVDPGAFAGRPASDDRMSGVLRGRVSGTEPDSLRGRMTLELARSRVGPVAVDSVVLQASVDTGRVEADLLAGAAGALLRARAEGGLGRVPSYTLRGSVEHPGSAGSDDPVLLARFGMDGRGIVPDSLAAEAWMEVDSARWRGRSVEVGLARLSLRDGVARVDTLALRLPDAELTATGTLPLGRGSSREGLVRLQARLTRAELLEGLAGGGVVALGEATADASARGSLEELELEGTARVSALMVDELRVQDLELQAEGRRTASDGWTEGRGRLRADRLRLPTAPVERVEVDGRLAEEGDVVLTASAVVDGRREVELGARIEEAAAPSAVVLERFSFRADRDRWTLTRPTRVALGGGFEVDSLELTAGDQAIRLRGRVGPSGPLDLHGDVQRFDIATVADLVGFPALRGRVSGSLALTGTARAPRLRSRLESRLEPTGAPAGRIRVSADYDPGTASLEASVELDEGPGLRASATLPVDATLEAPTPGLRDGIRLTADAAADSFPLRWFGAFTPASTVRDLEGVLDGRVEMSGPPDGLDGSGALVVRDAGVHLPRLGVRYREGMARIGFRGREIRIDTLRLRSGEGSVTASGSVTLVAAGGPAYDIAVRADRFRAVETSAVQVTTSGRLAVTGRGLAPRVTGRVDVERANLYLGDLATTSAVAPVELDEEDYEELAQVFGYRRPEAGRPTPPIFEAADLELEIRLGRASWVRQRANPELVLQFTGALSVQKAPRDSLRLVGTVEAVPDRSFVRQFGRRFALAEGTLTFQGAPGDTRVRVRAEYEVPSRVNPGQPEAVLALVVSGTPERLSLELSSTPPLEASDMVAYLLTGRPAGESLSGGGDASLTGTGGAVALGRVSGAVEAYAREEVGLDVVEITTEGLGNLTLLAGRYLSPDLYLGIRQPVSFQSSSNDASRRSPSPEIEVELQAVRWLLLNLRAGGRTGVEFYVRSRISYE